MESVTQHPSGSRVHGGEEPPWLAGWRQRAQQIYEETPLPIRADHLWRYTDPALFTAAIDRLTGELTGAADGATGSGDQAYPDSLVAMLENDEISGAVLTADGGLVRAQLGPELRKAGVKCLDFLTAAREQPELVQRALSSSIGPEFGKFEAWNAAVASGGLVVQIPRGVSIEKPIHLVKQAPLRGFSAYRLLVVVEDGASATIIDELTGGATEGQVLLSGVTEIQVGADARLSFVSLQTTSRSVQLHLTQRAVLARGARYVPVLASFGGALCKVDTGTILEGEGSETEMTGFLSAVGRQKFDHHTVHHHQGARTHSDLDFKAVLKDRSRSVYTGLIRIESNAKFTEAYQENRNLLLSQECRADSIPELEILTEEVQCTHGATVGPIDREHLFYLMSRAIPREEAICMVIEGHFESALKRLPEALQERMRTLVRERLRGA
jgi:Fe-S cluster assembly protein SufD